MSKLRKKLVNCDGVYEWETDYLGHRLTFSDDLKQLTIQKLDGDEVKEDYEVWDLVPHYGYAIPPDSGYYTFGLLTGGESITKNWDNDTWKPVNDLSKVYFMSSNRELWGQGIDQDGLTTEEEWENGTVAERILFVNDCEKLEIL